MAVDQNRRAEFAMHAGKEFAQLTMIRFVKRFDPAQGCIDRKTLVVDFPRIPHHARDGAEAARDTHRTSIGERGKPSVEHPGIEFIRFAVHVNGFPGKPDILQSATIKTMTTASSANAGYAHGWAVNEANNWWHGGSLPGTITIMVRTSGGFCWAALTNTRRPDSGMNGELDQMMWNVVGKVSTWPTFDLF